MDYVTASSMEWMEMDARTIHFHAVDTWTVDVEWIASLEPAIICTLYGYALVADDDRVGRYLGENITFQKRLHRQLSISNTERHIYGFLPIFGRFDDETAVA